MPFSTNIDSRTLPETQQQLLNEILKVLTMPGPYVFPPYIGLPPYQETKNDLLYQILMKLSGGSGGGGGGTVLWNRMEIRPTDPPGTLYELPAKCFLSHAIVKSHTQRSFAVMADNSVPGEEIEVVPFMPYEEHIPVVNTFAPVIYIPTLSKILLSGLNPADVSIDIFYTTTTI